MTSRDDFDGLLTAWLEADAPTREPHRLLDDVLGQTSRTRPLPGWVGRLGVGAPLAGPSRRWMSQATTFATVVAILLAIVGLAVVAGSRPQLPLPLGRAGLILLGRPGEVVLVDAAGAEKASIPTGNSEWDGLPSWSPDGSRVAFWAEGDGSPRIIVTDQALRERFRFEAPGEPRGQVTWAPDSQRLAFSTDGPDWPILHVLKIGPGQTPRAITKPGLAAVAPSWSPDGSWIAFRGGLGLGAEAEYVIHPDGTGVAKVSHLVGGIEDWPAAWAPDGSTLLYHSNLQDVLSVRPDGADEHIIDADPRERNAASWSPDGKRLAFNVRTDLGFFVFTADADGTDESQLDGPVSDGGSPTWSPDGTRIAYVARNYKGPRQLVVSDPSDVVPAVTFETGDAWIFGWQRLEP